MVNLKLYHFIIFQFELPYNYHNFIIIMFNCIVMPHEGIRISKSNSLSVLLEFQPKRGDVLKRRWNPIDILLEGNINHYETDGNIYIPHGDLSVEDHHDYYACQHGENASTVWGLRQGPRNPPHAIKSF